MTVSPVSVLRNFFSLVKLPVSLASAFAALFGYAACSQKLMIESIPAVIGVFFLSSGAAVLNNLQDKDIDRLMERTKTRPIASGRIGSTHALYLSLILISTGIGFLSLTASFFLTIIAGLTALILYNAVYTPLKTRTSFALLPGIISGSLPPLIGWLAAGGDLLSYRIAAIMIFFVTWQIPHFWLILLMRSGEYRDAGISNIMDVLTEVQLKRLLFVWVAAYALISIFSAFAFSIKSNTAILLIFANAAVLIIVFGVNLFRQADRKKYSALYHYLNISYAGIMLIALVDVII